MKTEEIETLRDDDIPQYSLTVFVIIILHHPQVTYPIVGGKERVSTTFSTSDKWTRQGHDARPAKLLGFSLVRKTGNSRLQPSGHARGISLDNREIYKWQTALFSQP